MWEGETRKANWPAPPSAGTKLEKVNRVPDFSSDRLISQDALTTFSQESNCLLCSGLLCGAPMGPTHLPEYRAL